MLSSRQRIATALGARQKGLLTGRTPTSATLVKRRDGRFFLHVQIKDDAPPQRPTTGTLGIDLGRRRGAVDFDGTVYEAVEVERLHCHYPTVRRSLQAKGTTGAKHLLKRLSGRERRHMRHINHVISRRIVDVASATARALALEDLTGIRARTTSRKAQRYHQHSWAFYQLRQFLGYKAERAGIPVVFVDPAYTSKTCHGCGVLGHRTALTFSCPRCGVFDADYNASLNIATAGAHVTEPKHAPIRVV